MAQALYRRWRPQTWEEVVGQDHVVQTLSNAVKGERVGHAYLFAGPRGTGKTTTARLLAKAVNCLHDDPARRPCNQCEHCRAIADGRFIDLIEIDAASNTSVEDVRDLRDKINFAPNEGAYKVYIVDEVHMLSTAAFNALLKTLEEPPGHAIFVLATTEVHKIPATVLSRCQRHEFRRLPVATILGFLQERVDEEGFRVEEEALELIARQATGSLRDAISLLDQLTSTGEEIDLERAQSVLGTATDAVVLAVVDALIDGEAGRGLTLLSESIDSGADPRQLSRQIVDYLRGLLLIQTGSSSLVEARGSIKERMVEQADSLPQERLLLAIDRFNEAALEGRANWQPKLPLELAMVRSLESPAVPDGGSVESEELVAGNPSRKLAEAAGGSEGREPGGGQTARASGSSKTGATAERSDTPQNPPLSEGAVLEFQHVLDRWESVLSAAFDRDPRCQALLNSGRPLGLKGGKLVLGFASDLLREKMEKGDNREKVLEALEAALGRPLGLRCVRADRWEGSQGSEEAVPVEEGGMVATALRDLGAEVAEVRAVDEDEEAES